MSAAKIKALDLILSLKSLVVNSVFRLSGPQGFLVNLAINFFVKKAVNEAIEANVKTKLEQALELLEQKMFACDGAVELAGNRGEWPDKFNAFMGIAPGNAYCLSSILYFISEVEKELSVDFKVPKIPSTQRFLAAVDKSYLTDAPKRFCLAIFQDSNNKALGHAVYVCDEPNEAGDFKTFEFNSNVKGSRDGVNVAMFLQRNTKDNKALKLINFIDLSKTLVEK